MEIIDQIAEIQVSYSPNLSISEKYRIECSSDVVDILKIIWNQETIAYQEAFSTLYFNRRNALLGYRWISFGGTTSTVVDLKHIFGIALKCNASNIIISHNHPSGNLKPSRQDELLTEKIVKAGNCLDIKALDHIIVIPEFRYYSFADEGIL